MRVSLVASEKLQPGVINGGITSIEQKLHFSLECHIITQVAGLEAQIIDCLGYEGEMLL